MAAVKLNLGCGDPFCHAPDPWVNVDVRPETQADVLADLLDLPWNAEEAELIYAGHVLEHLPYLSALDALREMHRVLVPGGRLLVVGPDSDKTLRLVAAGVISAERAAQNDGHTDEDNPALHSWFTSARQVLPLCWEAGFEAREVDITAAPPDFPVYDRVTPDQYAVICWKPA